MNNDRLKEILEQHKKWLMTRFASEPKGARADLRGADLRGANLCGANLCDADLRGADLRGADLRGANLRGADLRDADLRGADLRGANLFDANLCDADLCGANLRGADLRGADLRGADLRDANLCDADLCGADHDERTAFYALTCPEEGAFVGFKKASGRIVKLQIPDDAKRSSATTRKCRCDKALVLDITNIDGSRSGTPIVSSDRDSSFVYRVGEMVEVPDFDDERWNECSTGIHFFITRDEAVRY